MKTTGQHLGTKPAISPAFLIDVFRRWWKITIPSALALASIIASIVYVTFEPEYKAKVLLWISQDQPFLVQARRESERNFVENQLGLIRSSLVLGKLLSEPEIAKMPELSSRQDPIETLGKMITVSKAFGTEYYHISCVNSNPQSSAFVANAVADSYFGHVASVENGRTKELVEALEREKKATEGEVELLRKNVRTLSIEQTGRDPFLAPGDDKQKRQSPLFDLQNQITTIRLEKSVLASQITVIEEAVPDEKSDVSDSAISRAVEQSEEVQRQLSTIAEKKALMHDAKTKSPLGEGSERFRQLRREVEKSESDLAESRDKLRVEAEVNLRRFVDLEKSQKIDEMKRKLDELQVRETVLEKTYNEHLANAQLYTGETLTLQIKRAEMDRATATLAKISERVFLLKTEQRAPARVTINQRAEIPLYPQEFLPLKKLLVAIPMSLCVPFALAILWDLRIRRVSNPEQLEESNNIRVLGEVTTIPALRVRRSNKNHPELRLFEETIENLRTCLVISKSLADIQVLTITSAISGEGKTTIAAQLATSIARATKESTLLIDADMRSPDIHNVFEVKNKVGLAQLLEAGSLKDSIVPSWDSHLHILPAGRLRRSPHRLMYGGKLDELLAEAKKIYRHIIIDTAPTLAASETLLFAKASDATIICTMRDVSRQDQIKKTYNRLVDAGANVIGCVFNGISTSQYRYYYGEYNYGESPS